MTTILGEATSDVIACFMQQVILQYQGYGAAHQRKEPRESVAVPVRVQPLDDDLHPGGEAFQAVTRDISCGGVGLWHTQPVTARYVSIEMVTPDTHEMIRLLATVEHCTRFANFFTVGCRFVGFCPESSS